MKIVAGDASPASDCLIVPIRRRTSSTARTLASSSRSGGSRAPLPERCLGLQPGCVCQPWRLPSPGRLPPRPFRGARALWCPPAASGCDSDGTWAVHGSFGPLGSCSPQNRPQSALTGGNPSLDCSRTSPTPARLLPPFTRAWYPCQVPRLSVHASQLLAGPTDCLLRM